MTWIFRPVANNCSTWLWKLQPPQPPGIIVPGWTYSLSYSLCLTVTLMPIDALLPLPFKGYFSYKFTWALQRNGMTPVMVVNIARGTVPNESQRRNVKWLVKRRYYLVFYRLRVPRPCTWRIVKCHANVTLHHIPVVMLIWHLNMACWFVSFSDHCSVVAVSRWVMTETAAVGAPSSIILQVTLSRCRRLQFTEEQPHVVIMGYMHVTFSNIPSRHLL